jgi:hypothetical protein
MRMVVANPLKYPEDLCLECGVELDAFLLYSTSGIVQIMPEEFLKGLRIVDPSRAAYLFGPCCGSTTEGEQFLIGFVASITLPEREYPREDLPSIDL